MLYKSRIYKLNSLRLGLINEEHMYGKPSVFFTIGSQTADVESRVQKYIDLHEKGSHYMVAIPYDIDGSEPGDNYEIYTFYENFLGIKFYVTEKIDQSHQFFRDFGTPVNNFTEFHFDDKTNFVSMEANE
jgi:hypothetical protein